MAETAKAIAVANKANGRQTADVIVFENMAEKIIKPMTAITKTAPVSPQ